MKTKAQRYVFLLLFLLYDGALIFAQLPDYHVQMIMQKKGLSNPSQIREVMKDNRGFLWLMLSSKVQRFDGKNFVSFSFDEACVNIVQDEESVIWVVTRQAIYRYKNDYSGFEELTEYRSSTAKYKRLIAGTDKKIYLLSNEGITRWNNQAKKFELFGIASFRSNSSFPTLKNCGDWLFYKQDDTTLARYNIVTGAHDAVRVKDANFVVPLNADSVWSRQFIGNTVLVSFTAKTITPVTGEQFDEPLSGNSYFITGGMSRSAGEYLVLLNDKGCFSYNASKNRFSKINFFYDGHLVIGTPLPINNNFYQEENGTAWVANKEGLMYFNPLVNGLNLLSSNGKWDNSIRNFAEDQQGNIWFSTANGFCKWNKHNGNVSVWEPDYDADNYLNYSSVRSMAFSSGKILIGQSEKGFWLFDPLTGKFTRPKVEVDSLQKRFERDFNHNIVTLRNGNFLLLSNSTWLVRKGVLTVREIKLPDSIGNSRAGYEDAQGRIWLLTGRGIFALDSNFNELYSLVDRNRGRWINSIVQIDDTTFWAAAKNLFEIKLRTQKKLSIRLIFPELSEVHFSHLFKDSLQRIWMSNEDGIYRYIPETGAIEKYDHNDNAKGFYTAVSNSFRASDGTVYFGSLNGINYFVPEKIPPQKVSLQIHLLNVTVNHDDSSFLLYRSMPDLNYDQNSFVFDFIAPHVYNGDKV
ncbi:MAG: two-component regulator propeller domain-containing protein, partial [Chitinophagaceae bacterium]